MKKARSCCGTVSKFKREEHLSSIISNVNAVNVNISQSFSLSVDFHLENSSVIFYL